MGGNDDGIATQVVFNRDLGINIYKGGINDGWAMAMSANAVLLPVTIISFTAQWQNNDALLIWKTASESNHSHFEVERSTDGIHFEYIGRVNSAGNSSIVNNYHYSDLNIKSKLYTSILYYRLKSVDKDGKSVYTAVVILQHSKKGNELIYAVYPNPAQQYIMITGTQELVDQQITIRLMTLNGQVLQTRRMQNLQERIELAGYTAGQYLIQLVGNDHINFIQKIIKINQP